MPLPFYLNMFFYHEAVASVSLSHHPECNCKICRAAQGDDESMIEIIQKVMEVHEI